jgi:hypothetical protein
VPRAAPKAEVLGELDRVAIARAFVEQIRGERCEPRGQCVSWSAPERTSVRNDTSGAL